MRDRMTSPAGHPHASAAARRRAAARAIAAAALVAACCASGDGQPSTTASVPGDVRFVRLAAEDIAARITGEWQSVPRDDFDRLLQAARRVDSGPNVVHADRIEYRATVDGEFLRGGTFTAHVRALRPGTQWFDLGSCNLSLSDLRRRGGALIWGTTGDGRNLVRVDEATRAFTGTWGLRGRRIGQRVRFELQPMPATTSHVRLRLPKGWTLEALHGRVRGPVNSDDPNWSEWTVVVSSRDRLLLTVSPPSPVRTAPAAALYECDTLYVVRESGLQLQFRVDLRVYNSAIDRVAFLAPQDVKVYSVNYGGNTPLAFRIQRRGGENRIVVPLPDPLVGAARPLIVQAVAPAKTGPGWRLPRITPVGAAFLAGGAHLRIERPLELRSLKTTGMRQSEPMALLANGTKMLLVEDRPDGSVTLHVARPSSAVSFDVVSSLDLRDDPRKVTAELKVTARKAPVYSLRCRLDRRWRVSAVRAIDPSGTPGREIAWTEHRTRGSNREIAIELPDALGRGQSMRLQIEATDVVPRRSPLPLPVVVPVGADAVRSAVLLSHRSGTPAARQKTANFDVVEPDDAPEFVKSSSLWDPFRAGSGGSSTVLVSLSPVPQGELTLARSGRAFDAFAWNAVRFSPDGVHEEFVANVERVGEPVDSVFVYLSRSGPNPEWRFSSKAAERPVPLEATLVDAVRHQEWKLPAAGQLWELRLPDPQSAAFQLTARRRRSLRPQTQPTLLFLPQSRRFEGVFEPLNVEAGDVETTAAFPIADASDVLKKRPRLAAAASERLWRYRTADAAIRVARQALPRPDSPPSAARIRLQSILSFTPGGDDLHTAVFLLEPDSLPGRLEFHLPPSADVQSVRLNGRPTATVRNGETFVVPAIPAERSNTVQISYRTPSTASGLAAETSVPVPQTGRTVLDVNWRVALPPDARLTAGPASAMTSPHPFTSSWLQRLFGPLARPPRADPFNPFETSSWTRMWSAQPPGRGSGTGPVDDGTWAPAGWTVYEAHGPHAGESLTLQISSRAAERRFAWLALLSCVFAGWLIRRSEWPSRRLIGAIWFGLCLAAAFATPDAYAEIAGGALVGSFVVALLPRRWLRSKNFPEPADSGISGGSTVSYHRVPPATALLLFALALAAGDSPGWGQVPTRQKSRAALRRSPAVERTVYVPASTADNASAALVYVHRALLRELNTTASRRSARPDYVINDARYELTTGSAESADVRATFDVVLLADRNSVDVLLPLRDVHLCGPDACRVNGAVIPVRKDTGGRGFIVQLTRDVAKRSGARRRAADSRSVEASVGSAGVVLRTRPAPALPPERFRVSLCLRKVPSHDTGADELSFGIPRVAAGHVVLKAFADGRAIQVAGLTNVIDESGWFTMRIDGDLGPVDRLRVRWRRPDSTVVRDAKTKAAVSCMVEVRPSHLHYHYRVRYPRQPGRSGRITWSVPRTWVPARVELVGSATPKLPYHVIRGRSNDRLVEVELPASPSSTRPERDGFALAAEFLVPVAPSRRTISIALPRLHAGASIVESPQLVGISAPSEYTFQFAQKPAAFAAPLDEARKRSLRSQFESLRDLGAALQVAKPTVLHGMLNLRRPQRTVRQTQTGRVRRGLLHWTLSAEVTTGVAPAFRHRLVVDPRLRIRSLRVIEDEAPRLVRWAREGARVVLFLSTKTASTQKVVLEADMPLHFGKRDRLPSVHFADAQIELSSLRLYRAAGIGVEVVDPGDARSTGPPLPFSKEDGLPIARLDWPAKGRMPVIRTVPRRATLKAERTAILKRSPESGWKLECTLRLQDEASPSGYPIRLPAEIARNAEVTGDLWIAEKRVLSDGTGEWLLRPRDAVSKPPPLTFRIALKRRTQREWTLPLPDPYTADVADDYLLIADSLGRLDVRSPAQRVAVSRLPKDFAGEALDGAIAYRNRRDRWLIVDHPRRRRTAKLAVPLMETWLWPAEGAGSYGRTLLYVTSGPNASLTFHWPGGVSLRTLQIDGRLQNGGIVESGTLTVKLPQATAHVVQIDWASEDELQTPLFGRRTPPLPVPIDVEIERSLLRVAFPAEKTVLAVTGAGRLREVAFQLDRIAGLLSVARESEVSDIAARTAFAVARRDLSRLVERQSAGDPSSAEWRDVSKRIDEFQEQVDRLGKRFRVAGPTERPDRAAALAVGDDDTSSMTGSGAWLGRLAISASGETLSFWSIDRGLGMALLALAIGIPCAIAGRWVFRAELGELLAKWEPISWGLLGLLWWAFLTPSLLGLLLIIVAATKAVRSLRRSQQPDNVIRLYDQPS